MLKDDSKRDLKIFDYTKKLFLLIICVLKDVLKIGQKVALKYAHLFPPKYFIKKVISDVT